MVPQTQSVLKSYFKTGDKPTQAQFAEFIDTMFFLYQDMQSSVDSAVDGVNSATANLISAKVAMRMHMNSSGSAWVNDQVAGATAALVYNSGNSLLGIAAGYYMHFAFLAAFSNTGYLLLASGDVINKTVNSVDVFVGASVAAGKSVALVCF